MLWRVSDLDPERLELIGKLLKLVEVAGPDAGIDVPEVIADVRRLIAGHEGTVIDGIRANVDQAEASALSRRDGGRGSTPADLLDVLRAAIDARRPTSDLQAIRAAISARHPQGSEIAEADELIEEVGRPSPMSDAPP